MTHDIREIEERWAKFKELEDGKEFGASNSISLELYIRDIARLVSRVRELEAMLRRDAELLIEGKGLVEEYSALSDRYRAALIEARGQDSGSVIHEIIDAALEAP